MRALALNLVAVLALSGCASVPDSGPSSPDAWRPAQDVGALTGFVRDDELRPIAGAIVALATRGFTATADADGAYVLSGVPAGAHIVAFYALGHEVKSMRIQVEAGVQTRIDAQLATLAIDDAYAELLPLEGYIRLGEALLDIVTDGMPLPGCEACRFRFNATADVRSILIELEFQPTLNDPRGNELYIALYDLETKLYHNGYFKSLARVQVDKTWPAGGERFELIGACDIDFVCYEQRFSLYTTLFHNGEADPSYTALAPDR
jgi:hypothetical protein